MSLDFQFKEPSLALRIPCYMPKWYRYGYFLESHISLRNIVLVILVIPSELSG